MAHRHFVWVRYGINFVLDVSPLMGSLGRLVGTSLGKVVFLRITLLKKLHSNRRGGVQSGRRRLSSRGYRDISAHLCNPLNTCVSHFKQRELIEKVSHLWVSHSGRGEPPMSVELFKKS